MSTAAIEVLASDVHLAYVPLQTPEGDGITIRQDPDHPSEWRVEGSDEAMPYAEARAVALRRAAERWA